MKISIDVPGEKPIRLVIPTRLLFNSLTAAIGAQVLRNNKELDFSISGKDLRRLVRELHRMKRKHRNLLLVDVETADGTIVRIGF
jgi:hypothetical protein